MMRVCGCARELPHLPPWRVLSCDVEETVAPSYRAASTSRHQNAAAFVRHPCAKRRLALVRKSALFKLLELWISSTTSSHDALTTTPGSQPPRAWQLLNGKRIFFPACPVLQWWEPTQLNNPTLTSIMGIHHSSEISDLSTQAHTVSYTMFKAHN